MAEKPANTYALGTYLQLMHQHIPGIAKSRSGFIKDFFDIILYTYKLEEYESISEVKRQVGRSAISAGVWKGINETDLSKFYNGKRRLPPWKASSFRD
ncbi:hypothetical protein [Devriesea agamarum]|uniref:hypothetical protein n=1 Tax=Devriesea agamarum TaxID=472569 RepID=UPI00071CDD38|nr:hypothetical protein [Devriesea agamarum]